MYILTYKPTKPEYSVYLSQNNEDGKIDYTPYLKRLGISSIESLHLDFNSESSYSKQERIKVMEVKSNTNK